MQAVRVGLISDTHGLLRPQALAALRGCDHIVHGGDIGDDAAILRQLEAIAPVTVVRGNNDRGDWADAIRETETIELQGVRLHVIHELNELAIDPAAEGIHVVVSGHSHKPVITLKSDVLYVNPGSAGPRRFKLPVSVAELVIFVTSDMNFHAASKKPKLLMLAGGRIELSSAAATLVGKEQNAA